MNFNTLLKNFVKDFYNWYLAILTLLVSLPILAPILLKLGLTAPAKVIYFIYSFFCHQFASRSIHLFDFQYAWCARDTGIWVGVTLVAWLIKFKKIKAIKWYWALPFIVPIALDGGLQTIFTIFSVQPVGLVTGQPIYISSNLLRFITGALFGIGISLWVSGSLFNSDKVKEEENNIKDKENINKSQIFKIMTIFIITIFTYLGMVQLWNLTSVQNKPAGIADFIVKTPQSDFFERRADAVCPVKDINNLFNLDCFIK